MITATRYRGLPQISSSHLSYRPSRSYCLEWRGGRSSTSQSGLMPSLPLGMAAVQLPCHADIAQLHAVRAQVGARGGDEVELHVVIVVRELGYFPQARAGRFRRA